MDTILNIINTKVGIGIITAIASGVVTLLSHIAYLKLKQRASFETVIGDKIANALDTVRDVELLARSIEIYDTDSLLEENDYNLNFFEQQAYYPTILASLDNFNEFFDKVSNARGDCEKYLNQNTAAYLYYIERYCSNVMVYVGKNNISLV